MQKEIGGPRHELLPVRELKGAPRVDCRRRGELVLFSECQSCEQGTVLRLKGSRLPFLVCPSDSDAPGGLQVWPRDPVSSIMTKAVPVKRSLTIERLLRLFMDEGLSAAPVVDEDSKVIGVIAKSDLNFDDIGWTELRDAALSSHPEGVEQHSDMLSEDDLYLQGLLRERTVGDVMPRTLVWVGADVTVAAAAEVMAGNGLHHLAVLGPGDRPVGMLSALELAQWLGSRR
jgi:CBS domain-containing protein